MKIFFTIASLIVISCSLEWYEEDNPVFLTDENFTQIMSVPRTYKFVKLFTPWCHFCRVLKEIVKELKP
jgi:thiol-disulfide isomerase/thioredoxin